MEKAYRCCICGGIFKGWGNNPRPLREAGTCCDKCNEKVIKARIKEHFKTNK